MDENNIKNWLEKNKYNQNEIHSLFSQIELEKNKSSNKEIILPENILKIKEGNFTLLLCDFSGIQSYIFDMHKTTFDAKRLRSRSFFVHLLLEEVKHKVLEKFNLTLENILFQAGGKFYALIPENQKIESNIYIENKISDLKKELDEVLWEKFQGEISLEFGWTESFDIAQKLDFSSKVLEADKKLQERKLQPLKIQKNITKIILFIRLLLKDLLGFVRIVGSFWQQNLMFKKICVSGVFKMLK